MFHRRSNKPVRLVEALDQEGLVIKKKKNTKKKAPTELSFPNTPTQLENSHINTIGQKYIDLYGKDPKRMHKSHPIARELQQYNLDNDSDDKWRFLIKKYKELSKFSDNNGKLITSIRVFFEKVFKESIPTERDSTELSVEEVAEELTNIINTFYVKYFKQLNQTLSTQLEQYNKELEETQKISRLSL